MKTFKWELDDDFGLGDLSDGWAEDLRSRLATLLDPESEFFVGEGPWSGEPDKGVWVDDATGLDCMIHRSPGMGYLCGYVGVPEGHPLHGCDDWDFIEHATNGAAPRSINFTSGCDEGAVEAFGICHVPEPGRSGNVWWIGFDCGHIFDRQPVQEAVMRWSAAHAGWAPEPRGVYRDFDTVRGYVERLAEGLACCGASVAAMRREGAGRRSRHA